MVGGRPGNSPDQAFNKLVDALARGDWGAVYDTSAPSLQRAITKSAFSSAMTNGRHGNLGRTQASVILTGTPTLVQSPFGYWTAQANLKITSGSTSVGYKVVLQNVDGRWLLLSIR